MMKELNAFTVGQLIALYENRIAVEGFLYNVNSFDQFGVELGKVLANRMRKDLTGEEKGEWNSATSLLVEKFKEMRK